MEALWFMPKSWKVDLIKLIPKVTSPKSLHQWRPLSLMRGLYKVFAKTLPTDSIKSYFNIFTHLIMVLLHNVLTVQMATDYAQHTHKRNDCTIRFGKTI